MRRNLVLLVLALVLAFALTEYNQHSRCREWRLELALREQGVVSERSWGEATVDFVSGDLMAVGKKWECGIEIDRGEAVWAAVEAATLVPAIGAAVAWTLRTIGLGLGLVEIGVAAREATALRGVAGFVRGPMALVGRITAQRLRVLVLGGTLLAVYLGSGQLLLDALALLPWPLQFALWAVPFFCIGRCIWLAVHAIALLGTSLRAMWSRLIGPRLAPEG